MGRIRKIRLYNAGLRYCARLLVDSDTWPTFHICLLLHEFCHPLLSTIHPPFISLIHFSYATYAVKRVVLQCTFIRCAIARTIETIRKWLLLRKNVREGLVERAESMSLEPKVSENLFTRILSG